MTKEKTVVEIQEECADILKERLSVYGESYKKNGLMLSAMFPEGITLKTAEDFSRFSAMNWIIGKLNRYSQQFENGGHYDSAIDIANYSVILAKLTIEIKNEN